MLLELRFFSINDIFLVPLCVIILYAIIRNRASRHSDPFLKRVYYNAFYFKLFCVFAYTFITEFYFGGGDTGLYYQGVKDLRAALEDDTGNIGVIINSSTLEINNPLAPYFLYDNYAFDITFNYMRSAANFFMPRLGLIPSLFFFNSYLCISLCFSFFALGGAIRLFKTFYYFYPTVKRELTIAILFLPSVGFWSSGLMKDTICFACVGFFVYGVANIFFMKRKYLASFVWMVITGYLLYVIKTYIFLVLLLAVVIWIFAETNKLIKERTLRQVFALLTFIIGISVGFFLLQYFTSEETLRQYQFENIVSSAEYQRSNYQTVDESLGGQSSYYSINTSNPFLLVFNGIVAVFFRPFVWEINSAAAVLSAIEALGFLLLTGHLLVKRGLSIPFKQVFNDPKIFMCFIFAIVFAIGVGASTANFGALSRYKIPCMPFYLVMIILLYKNTGLMYPKWFIWFLRKTIKT
jgi:hypothetical protein